jgi:hypothetical protein
VIVRGSRVPGSFEIGMFMLVRDKLRLRVEFARAVGVSMCLVRMGMFMVVRVHMGVTVLMRMEQVAVAMLVCMEMQVRMLVRMRMRMAVCFTGRMAVFVIAHGGILKVNSTALGWACRQAESDPPCGISS